jgi:hypothetical protein
VSNELSNHCGANGQSRLDDPGSFGAPGILIDAHLACFTPKRSLVEPSIAHQHYTLSEADLTSAVSITCRLRAGTKLSRSPPWHP